LAGAASRRKLRSAGPRLPGPGGAPCRTNDLDRASAVWLPPVCAGPLLDGWLGIPELPGSRGAEPRPPEAFSGS